MMNSRALVLSAALLLGATGAAVAQEAPLKIIAIDVEGGTATLVVTPQGHSILFDAGWPPGMGITRPAAGAAAPATPTPGSTERIVATARQMGLTKIDYLVTTHYHVDHVGGVPALVQAFPIGTFVDHGENREISSRQTSGPNSPVIWYKTYLDAIAGKPHRVMKAGETLKVDGLTLTAVDSDWKFTKPLPGAGKANPACGDARPHDENDEIENQHSLGVIATYGKARVLMLSDQVWNIENQTVCPIDLIGKVDLAFVNNHGTDTSTSPVYLRTIRPTVMVMSNGATKGAGPETLKTLHSIPDMDVWQVHLATRSPELNYPADQIANLEALPNANNPLHVNVLKSGAITLINARNGYSKTYPKAK